MNQYGAFDPNETPDFAAQEEDLLRRRHLANMLQKQGLQPTQGSMAGKVYVPPSITQGLSQMFNAYLGGKMEGDITKQRGELESKKGAILADIMQKANQPTQTVEGTLPEGQMGPGAPMETGPNWAELIGRAHRLGPGNAALVSGLMGASESRLGRKETLGAHKEEMQYKMAERARAEQVALDEKKARDRDAMANKPFYFDEATGRTVPNPEYQKYEMTKARENAPRTNISVSTEKKYGEQFGSKIAEEDIGARAAALKGPEMVQRAQRIISTLDKNPITGFGAEARLQVNKAFAVAGLVSGKSAAETENLMSDMAGATMDNIRSSGLGAGQGFTNTDRQFLEKAVAGQITSEPGNIRKLAKLSMRAAYASHKKWETRKAGIPGSALQGTGLDRERIEMPRPPLEMFED